MGIERFFNSLAKSENIKNIGIVIGSKEKIITDYFYIDFNSIIYNIVNEIESELNYLLYSIILLDDTNTDLVDTKAIEIAHKWKYEAKPSVESYKNYFNGELIDKIAIERVKNYVIYTTTKLVDPNNLKLLYVSLDGVPQMSKIIEQKKRRYNGYVTSKLKNKIYAEHNNSLSVKRKLYEQHKISYDRGKIISRATFMKNISDILISKEFQDEIKTNLPLIEEIIISHQNVFGEGEKKIMEHILGEKKMGKYTIYSPDADAIILGIIGTNLLNNGSTVNILRYNQQTLEYDTVDIDILCNNMFAYVNNEISKITKKGITKLEINEVTNDIAFIFTLFGNDFVPKVESIDVRNNIETLINIYCICMANAKKKYLMFKHADGNYRINFINFYDFIKLVAGIEDVLLLDTYMSNKYKNYSYFKRELGTDRLYPILEKYIPFANQIFSRLRGGENIKDIVRDNSNNISLIKNFLVFENSKFDKLITKEPENSKILNYFEEHLYKMHSDSMKKGYKIKGKMRFQLYDSHTIDTAYHIKNMTELLPHPKMEITEYDKEIYKLEKRLDKYEIKLNATGFDLGGINIGLTETGDYKMIIYNKLGNVINYYDTFFGISHEKKVITTKHGIKKILTFGEKMDILVNDYITGLFWVFDSYFNKNDSEYNAKYVSTWFYPHHRAPLLYQVREVLYKYSELGLQNFNGILNSMYASVTSSTANIVLRDEFMSTLEHYLYVTPKNKHHDVPEKYKEIIDKNPDIFPDLDKISHQIWSDENNSSVIECKRVPYISKCNLLGINFVLYSQYMNKMRPVENIETSEENNQPNISKFKIKPLLGGSRLFYNLRK